MATAKILLCLLLVTAELVQCLAVPAETLLDVQWQDDFHYPPEEVKERAELVYPQLLSISGTQAVLTLDGKQATVSTGTNAFGLWQVRSVSSSPGFVTIVHAFDRWGIVVVLRSGNLGMITLRKSIGQLKSIKQPFYNFTATDPHYFDKIGEATTDIASEAACNHTIDNEPDYPSLASVLAPQRDIASISNPNDVVKFVVTFNGRVKCGKTGITETINQTALPLNNQTIVFDPADHLHYWPERFANAKMGLVGGHLRIANVGAFDQDQGYELTAFAPMISTQHSSPAAPVPCNFSGPFPNTYVALCSEDCKSFETLQEAEAACENEPSCNGITQKKQGRYELRAASTTAPSPIGETSWLLANGAECRTLPRLPYINYNPGVYIELIEELAGGATNTSYFYANNASLTSVSDIQYYTKLIEYTTAWNETWSEAMEIQLPEFERRQEDMAKSGIQSAFSNFVGHQPNYGNGMTYWSVAREDNGSLPLNILSVGEAMFEWGLCKDGLENLAFYFDNYVNPDGTINYYTWGAGPRDSVADHGRLIWMYLRATTLCPDADWEAKNQHYVLSLGMHLLQLWQGAQKPGPSETQGLLKGAPEHDWGSVTNLAFYNNNAWTVRGLSQLADYVAAKGLNATFLQQLQTASSSLAKDLQRSVELCVINDTHGNPVFLPPYAHLHATPYQSMTESRESSYANFRFWSETILADVLPRSIENVFLSYHNEKGGRVGGASRFEKWLDDMPTAGWGYGALTSNRTQDFLALLYGHMATYQSRGTFHATEQLQWIGEGWYRSFLHWPNPVENAYGYYAQENDVSFCIVTEVLMARLTRWQLVFEDFYRDKAGSIWLGRGAPRRWFSPSAGGFGAKNVPTQLGKVSFTVQGVSDGTAEYSVSSPKPLHTTWRLRWPGQIGAVNCSGATVIDTSTDNSGIAAVVSNSASFSCSASFE